MRGKNILPRAMLLHINAIFPFLYPMRYVLGGRVFAGFYRYAIDFLAYRKADSLIHSGFPLKIRNTFPCLLDRYDDAGSLPTHYFWQDLWGARKIFNSGVKRHYDIGSRLDGFVAHCLPFCEIVMLDIRPLKATIKNLSFLQANGTDMSTIPDDSLESFSSLHAVEHFGLGRYGDPIDPLGYKKAIMEIQRVVKPAGEIYFSVPIGIERLEFNGHRIFYPHTVLELFHECDLVEFSVIDDENMFHENIEPSRFSSLKYGCGLFHFRKRLNQPVQASAQ